MTCPFLSIVIPAYNEEARLSTSLGRIIDFLQTQPFSSEVLVVDDGSEDNTGAITKRFVKRHSLVSLLTLPHRGKGHAVKSGVLVAQGDYIFACDADLSMPIEAVLNLLPPSCQPYDIAIGSREVAGARRYDEPFYRHWMGRVFNFIVRATVVHGFSDTQAGFKCFRRDVAHKIFPYQTIDGWSFDVEILHIAQRHGYRIIEIPIQWHYIDQSRVKPVQDTINMLREVWRIRRNSLAGLYDAKVGNSVMHSRPISRQTEVKDVRISRRK